jgi:hypothetical protein
MNRILSVKYTFSFKLSAVFCLDSANVFVDPQIETDTVEPQLPEACRLLTWHHDRMRSCQATGNNNPGTSLSAIAKTKKILPFNELQSIAAGPAQPLFNMQLRPCCFKLKHFEELFSTPTPQAETGR